MVSFGYWYAFVTCCPEKYWDLRSSLLRQNVPFCGVNLEVNSPGIHLESSPVAAAFPMQLTGHLRRGDMQTCLSINNG